MRAKEIVLTEGDQQILESYRFFAEGLSHYLGKSCEIILHSLENFDHSAIKVINGYHTGRKEGAPITNLALSMLSRIQENREMIQDIPYFTKNNKGEPMKSTTITIRGEQGRIIGLMCINFYLNTALSDVLADLSPQAGEASYVENFAGTSNEWILDTVDKIKKEVFHDPSITASCKNKEIVKRLNDEGIFNLKDSVITAAEALNISKNTIYLHLRNLSE